MTKTSSVAGTLRRRSGAKPKPRVDEQQFGKFNRGQTVGLSTLNPFAYNWAMWDRGWKQETERGCTRDVDDNYAHR